MDRLKKEWQETQISNEAGLRAKNRAWDKIHRPVFRVRNGAAAFAACAIALAALFVIFRNVPNMPEEQMNQIPRVAAQNISLSDAAPASAPVDPVDSVNIDTPPAEPSGITDVIADIQDAAGINENIQPPEPSAAEIAAARYENEEEDFAPWLDETPADETALFALFDDMAAMTETDFSETALPKVNDEPSRVIFNFILPESGTRLIWLASSNL
jgi:hypothetical protein